MPRISLLNPTEFPSLEHWFAASKEGETVRLSIQQIRDILLYVASEIGYGSSDVKTALDALFNDKAEASEVEAALQGKLNVNGSNVGLEGLFGLGGDAVYVGSVGHDLNTETVTRIIKGQNMVPAPPTGSVYNTVLHISYASSSTLYALQIAWGATGSGNNDLAYRRNVAGGWQPWSRLVSTANPWIGVPLGMPFPLWDHLPNVPVPPTNKAERFIKLTASDAYNTGVLTGETVSGSFPLLSATAVISLADSPFNGQTIRLINTEGRVLRAGNSGTAQNDALQGHFHEVWNPNSNSNLASISNSSGTTANPGPISNERDVVNSNRWHARDIFTGDHGTPRVSTETRMKNIGANFYMRIA